MRNVQITRTESTDEGTFGKLVTDTGFSCFSGELPWRNNDPDTSCIPPGKYLCSWSFSPRLVRNVYHVDSVPNRDAIEIHPANFMGDARMGYRCDLRGCIALGLSLGVRYGQKILVSSRSAVMEFEKEMNQEEFELQIQSIS